MIKGDNGYISWEDNSIENLVDYINEQLNSRKMDLIEKDDFGVNKRVIEKRLARKGYKKFTGSIIKGGKAIGRGLLSFGKAFILAIKTLIMM